MHRSWLVLLVVCGVALAGCSAPLGNPTTDGDGSGGGDVSYPDGWGPDGPDNATQVTHGAEELVAGDDFVERWIAVEATRSGMEEDYLVVVTEVRVDRDQERLLSERHFYLVDAELAGSVADGGLEPLADRRANESRQTYLNASGGVESHRLEEREPRITRLESADFAAATDQPLPATLVGSASVFESATYSNPTQANDGVRYSISNVSAFHVEDGAGRVTVESDGLVSGYDISEADPDSEETFRYELEVGDVSVDPPEWAG